MKVFGNPVTINGTAQQDQQLVQNILFFELIIWLGIRIANLATMGKIKIGNPLAHLFGTLRRSFGLWIGLFFAQVGLFWYQIIHNYGKQTGVDNRAHFNVWLSWLLAFYVHAEVIWSIVEVALYVNKAGQSGRAKTYSETQNPGALVANGVQQSYDQFIDEVAFMHQHKKTALASPITQWYNVAYLVRWLLIMFFAVTWFDKPRTMYWIIIVLEMGFLGLTIVSLKSFNKPSGILILVSESLTLARHFVQVINWHDQAGTGGMAQFWVDFNTHIGFWGYIFATFIEFALLFAPLYAKGSGSAQENAASEDIRLDLESNNELGNKINTYKSMKSGKVSTNSSNPGSQRPGVNVPPTNPSPQNFNPHVTGNPQLNPANSKLPYSQPTNPATAMGQQPLNNMAPANTSLAYNQRTGVNSNALNPGTSKLPYSNNTGVTGMR